MFGGAKRDRTADLNTASVALSQLSYSPRNLDFASKPLSGNVFFYAQRPEKVRILDRGPLGVKGFCNAAFEMRLR